MKAGGLVSDDIVVGIIRDRIKHEDCRFGFILTDSLLDEVLKSVFVDDGFTSHRSYHVKFAPPKSMKLDAHGKPIPESMLDDVTKEPLMQRPDDTAAALVKRLQGYHGETVPILDHYKPHGVVRGVNANQDMDGVWAEVLAALKRTA
ncbi:adenylate kinase [Fragilaria crotonensis]|nr:adenylate kinase [Fragilaria crotonensis]